MFRSRRFTLAKIYSLPVRDEAHAKAYGYATQIDRGDPAPRIWLEIIRRVYALGALAVRLKDWPAVRTLTVQLPESIDYGYEVNWLRHAITMASRAQHLVHVDDGQADIGEPSITSSFADLGTRMPVAGGDLEGDEAAFDALAQFDVLSNIVAIGDAQSVDTPRSFSPISRGSDSRGSIR